MHSLVRSRLEAARKQLLDLGLRNPLVSYRHPATKGIEIVQEDSAIVFDQLVRQGKLLTFAAVPAAGKEKGMAGGLFPANQADTRLQTAEEEDRLQQRLLNTYYTARTIIEEQGVNTLYLALGMLHWYESEASTEVRKAPLVLVPVTLERSTARERFRVKYTEEDLGANLSLEAKLKTDFGIELPQLPDDEELDLPAYFANVAAQVVPLSRWQVHPHAIVLGFFSFGKFLLYNDLEEDNWPESNQPSHHPLLQSLLGDGFRDPAPSVGEDVFLDDVPEANDLLQALDADATQLLAMLAVHEGRNLVIQGPPGTGKSQTITNIIANAIGQGKKVLFVAEKSAALEVVKRRLDALQLGEACLELHSHKANKKELHTELRRTLELGKPALQHLQQQVALLAQHREELNAYSRAVNTELQQSGLTAHDAMGHLLKLKAATKNIALPALQLSGIAAWNATRMQSAEAFAERIQAGLKADQTPSSYLFWGSGLSVLLPRQYTELSLLLEAAAKVAASLKETAKVIAQQGGFPVPQGREACMVLAEALRLAATRPELAGIHISASGWKDQQQPLTELIQAGERLQQLRSEYASVLLPEAWDADVLSIRAALVAHGDKWHRFIIGEYKTAMRQLAALCTNALPKEVSHRRVMIEAILEAQRLQKTLRAGEPHALHYLGAAWKANQSDWKTLQAATDYLVSIENEVLKGRIPAEIKSFIARNLPVAAVQLLHDQLLQKIGEHGRLVQETTTALAFQDAVRFPGATLLHQPFDVQVPLLQAWTQRLEELLEVIAFNNLRELGKDENLEPLVDLAAHWLGAKNYLKAALQQTWYEHLLEVALTSFAPLRKFERTAHETVLEQFRQLDVRSLHYNRARAALRHWEGLPPADAGGQMNLLRSEFNKKARHLPIRRLMSEAGLAIQAIKPVFMMSPLSIANFIAPGTLQFDLVIFDEASQVKPVEALGALLRGRQLVVVGDSKQLPPTSFFDNLTQEESDDKNFTADLPSILSLCDAQGAPQRMLRWHYRSRHESLIRLSNQEFYDNRLVIFPSPGSRQGAGLFYHHLPETVYDRGQTRTNQQEAEKLVQHVMEHVRKSPQQSLGVVAFSSAQRDAIQDRVEAMRKQHPEMEAFFLRHQQEPFFVKNLENVQGDERDVVFISIGYGRTKEGLVSQSFGPLNNEGGEKRLNVLVTRARLRCEVFTNLTAEDIDTTNTISQGLRVLKSFLQFAQKGILERPLESRHSTDSPFEEAVAEQLKRRGYQVHRQLGASGFFIDLAISDPEHPGRYVLGIECDGATYHSARSARDRDRLRQQVLEAMGWKIHRVWSTDWYRNAAKEMERLVNAINSAWKAALDAGDEEEEPLAETSLLREPTRRGTTELPPYQMVQLPAEIAQAEMHQHPVGKLAKWVELVVRVEGPVHFDELARRMVEAAGITRIGPRIKDHLKLATRFAEGSGAIRQNGDFLYLNDNNQPPMRNRSALPAASRKWKYVAPEEMAAVLYKVVREAVAIEPDEAYPIVVKLLGFTRVTEEMRNDILSLLPAMEASGLLIQQEGILKAES